MPWIRGFDEGFGLDLIGWIAMGALKADDNHMHAVFEQRSHCLFEARRIDRPRYHPVNGHRLVDTLNQTASDQTEQLVCFGLTPVEQILVSGCDYQANGGSRALNRDVGRDGRTEVHEVRTSEEAVKALTHGVGRGGHTRDETFSWVSWCRVHLDLRRTSKSGDVAVSEGAASIHAKLIIAGDLRQFRWFTPHNNHPSLELKTDSEFARSSPIRFATSLASS